MRWLAAIEEDRRTYALKLLLVAAVYYGAAKLGLSLASTQEERGRVYRIAAPEQA